MDWQQDIFDLMCNENIRLEVKGEIDDVSAELSILHGSRFFFVAHGEGTTFDNAMNDLMTHYVYRQATDRDHNHFLGEARHAD